jgi:hypothetical protein
MKQISFATLAETGKKRKTKRERFLEEMETVAPWATLMALIEPHYPKAVKGRRPRGLETMLRIYFVPSVSACVASSEHSQICFRFNGCLASHLSIRRFLSVGPGRSRRDL